MIFFIYWTLDISQTASYEITLVNLSIYLTVCSSNSKWDQCYSRNLEVFSIVMSLGIQSNLTVYINKMRVLISFNFDLLNSYSNFSLKRVFKAFTVTISLKFWVWKSIQIKFCLFVLWNICKNIWVLSVNAICNKLKLLWINSPIHDHFHYCKRNVS